MLIISNDNNIALVILKDYYSDLTLTIPIQMNSEIQ